MKVSVHVIAKETTPFGKMMFKSCLDSIDNYADELIIVDNGCTPDIKLMYDTKMNDFKNYTIIRDEGKNFKDLRNKALDTMQLKSPETFIHWIDTDEVYFKRQLNILKDGMRTTYATITTELVHFMITPSEYQYMERKRNIYRWNPNLKWVQDVHERIENNVLSEGTQANTDLNYMHLGYVREQWRTFLKWMQYAILEHKNLQVYKDENVDGVIKPYLRDWRTPNTCLEDRRKEMKSYNGNYPVEMSEWLGDWLRSGLSWEKWMEKINGIDPLWIYWQELYKEKGNWRDTLDLIAVKMGWITV